MGNSAQMLKYWTKKQPSAAALRVAELLDRWVGLHHLDSEQMSKVDWAHPHYVVIKLDARLCSGQMATFDFDALTTLVFLAHDLCIRVDIAPVGKFHLRLMFHPRASREGQQSQRHPTIERALSYWRIENRPVNTVPQACRVCGCTDGDCRHCIQKTGVPCSWVEVDLCSACAAGGAK